LPVLEGIDGGQRMSKSLGNYIGIDDQPEEMFGKVMSIPDRLILKYFTLVTDCTLTEIESIAQRLADPGSNPMTLKKDLAHTLVRMYHSEAQAIEAQQHFERVFSRRELPDAIETITVRLAGPLPLVKLLTENKIVASNGEAKRLIQQGGIRINDLKISDLNHNLSARGEFIVKVGKRRFVKFIVQ